MKKWQKIKNWAKKHRKILKAFGITVISVAVLIFLYRNWDRVLERWEEFIMQLQELKSEQSSQPDHQETDFADSVSSESSDLVTELFTSSETEEKATRIYNQPINVRAHLRKLPDGQEASDMKKKLAEQYNLDLEGGMTWVAPYQKGLSIA